MTEQELDQKIRRILLDALKADEEQVLKTPVSFVPSPRYQQRMREMRNAPLKWLDNRLRPMWRRILRQVAMILLVLSVGLGCLVATVPTVRAAVIRWITEWYETHIVYRYVEERTPTKSMDYEITILPDGFVETGRIALTGISVVTYGNTTGDVLSFNYSFMHQGGAAIFNTDDCTMSDIYVNDMPGHFFEANTSGHFNSITWIDKNSNIQFTISGNFEQDMLLLMAQSVSFLNTF